MSGDIYDNDDPDCSCDHKGIRYRCPARDPQPVEELRADLAAMTDRAERAEREAEDRVTRAVARMACALSDEIARAEAAEARCKELEERAKRFAWDWDTVCELVERPWPSTGAELAHLLRVKVQADKKEIEALSKALADLNDGCVELEKERDEARRVAGHLEGAAVTLRRELASAESRLAEVEKERDGAKAMCRALGDAVKYADESQEEMASLLAEVEAQASAMREALVAYDEMLEAIKEGPSDSGVSFVRAENRFKKLRNLALSTDAGRALLAELQALRVVRDAAEETVAMSQPGMPTLRDVAVDALRAALDGNESLIEPHECADLFRAKGEIARLEHMIERMSDVAEAMVATPMLALAGLGREVADVMQLRDEIRSVAQRARTRRRWDNARDKKRKAR